ncbi:hypothetical protein HDV04_004595 [Boothiomyces sp. JEL0838]|nr:hypothetical protein HDV04_004595 [Boothiomyces sp. JEL0838]
MFECRKCRENFDTPTGLYTHSIQCLDRPKYAISLDNDKGMLDQYLQLKTPESTAGKPDSRIVIDESLDNSAMDVNMENTDPMQVVDGHLTENQDSIENTQSSLNTITNEMEVLDSDKFENTCNSGKTEYPNSKIITQNNTDLDTEIVLDQSELGENQNDKGTYNGIINRYFNGLENKQYTNNLPEDLDHPKRIFQSDSTAGFSKHIQNHHPESVEPANKLPTHPDSDENTVYSKKNIPLNWIHHSSSMPCHSAKEIEHYTKIFEHFSDSGEISRLLESDIFNTDQSSVAFELVDAVSQEIKAMNVKISLLHKCLDQVEVNIMKYLTDNGLIPPAIAIKDNIQGMHQRLNILDSQLDQVEDTILSVLNSQSKVKWKHRRHTV